MKSIIPFNFEQSASRRRFLRQFSAGLSAAVATPGFALVAQACDTQSQESQQQATTQESARKLGIALVGLGSYSSGQLAPALQQTTLCQLNGIVTGTPAKAGQWKKQYNIPEKNVYNYQTFDRIADNPDIDIIYIVLPNGMHAEYAIRAAQAGKHVICEKPMATSVKDCEAIIAACKKAGQRLSIGYRLHFEPYNLEMMRLGQEEIFGKIKTINTGNGYYMGDGNQSWRIDKELGGGGPLMDMGIYSVQAMRYVTGKEPLSVTARAGKNRKAMFSEVEEFIEWEAEFPGGILANGNTSYAANLNHLRVESINGWFELSQAFRYGGMAGTTSKGSLNFPEVNQQALQMDNFADCILHNKPTRVPGEMGLQDVKILQAIYQAAETGNKISIA